MGGGHAKQEVDQTKEQVNQMITAEEKLLSAWEATIVAANGGQALTDYGQSIRVSTGESTAVGQIKTILTSALQTQTMNKDGKPSVYQGFTTFDLLLNTFQTSLSILLQNTTSGQGQSQQGVFLSSSGYDVVKLYYYLHSFEVSAEFMLSHANSAMVAYGYAVVPITTPLTVQSIGEYLEQMNIPPPQKARLAKKLFKIYLNTLNPQQLEQIHKQQQIIHTISNPFSSSGSGSGSDAE